MQAPLILLRAQHLCAAELPVSVLDWHSAPYSSREPAVTAGETRSEGVFVLEQQIYVMLIMGFCVFATVVFGTGCKNVAIVFTGLWLCVNGKP